AWPTISAVSASRSARKASCRREVSGLGLSIGIQGCEGGFGARVAPGSIVTVPCCDWFSARSAKTTKGPPGPLHRTTFCRASALRAWRHADDLGRHHDQQFRLALG